MLTDLFADAPRPLRDVLAEYEAEADWGRRRSRLSDAYEWVIKWHATLVYADRRRAGVTDRGVERLLAREFAVPATGNWYALYERLLGLDHDGWAPWIEWDRLRSAEGEHQGISVRNDHSHLGTIPELVCQTHIGRLEALLQALAGSPTLARISLESGERAAPGSAFHRAVAVSEGRDPLDLWPFAYYDRSSGDRFYFYQDVKKSKRVHLLHYAVPATATEAGGRHDRALFPPFRDELFPRREAEGDDPYERDLDELTEHFVGRDDILESLLVFAKGGSGTRLVTGEPGIGKSALLARLITRARADAGGPHVLHHLLGSARGASLASSTPAAFLKRLADGLDRAAGGSRPLGDTVEERRRGVEERLAALDAAPPPGGVLLVVDGLDEAPEVAEHVPFDRPWLRVVTSGRWVGAVAAFYSGRHRERRERVELPPLPESAARELLARVVNRYNARFDPYVAGVLRASEGNPLYLKLLCDGLEKGDYAFDGDAPLPSGVGEQYGKAVKRITREDENAYRALLALAAAREPLAAPTVAAVWGWMDGTADDALDGAAELTRRSGTAWSVYHETLRVWLAERFPNDARGAERGLADLAERWGSERGAARAYALKHGSAHLARLGDLDGLWSFLRDEGRRAEQVEDEGHGGGAVDDLWGAVGVFLEGGQHDRAAWCALRAGELSHDPSAGIAPLAHLLSEPSRTTAGDAARVRVMASGLLPEVAARAVTPLVALGLEAQASLAAADRSAAALEALAESLDESGEQGGFGARYRRCLDSLLQRLRRGSDCPLAPPRSSGRRSVDADVSGCRGPGVSH